MQETPKTESRAAAEEMVAAFGEPVSRAMLIALLAAAYSRGALAAATEAVAVARRA